MPKAAAVGRGIGRNIGQLLGRGIGVDGTIPVNQHPVRQAHEKYAGNQQRTRPGFNELQGRPDGVGRGMNRTGNHAVGLSLVDHHGAEIADIGQGVKGHFPGNALVPAGLIIGLGELLLSIRR